MSAASAKAAMSTALRMARDAVQAVRRMSGAGKGQPAAHGAAAGDGVARAPRYSSREWDAANDTVRRHEELLAARRERAALQAPAHPDFEMGPDFHRSVPGKGRRR
jgi:hypothetical protein